MKNHKFQLVRIPVKQSGAEVRYSGETDRAYGRLRGVFVALPDVAAEHGSTLSLKLGGLDVFDDDHDVRLVTCGRGVAPQAKFFAFEEDLEARGNTFEGRYRDVGAAGVIYPYEAKVFLWLVNDAFHAGDEEA